MKSTVDLLRYLLIPVVIVFAFLLEIPYRYLHSAIFYGDGSINHDTEFIRFTCSALRITFMIMGVYAIRIKSPKTISIVLTASYLIATMFISYKVDLWNDASIEIFKGFVAILGVILASIPVIYFAEKDFDIDLIFKSNANRL